jgi:DNA-binding transcriptional regulator YbjK
VSTPNESNNYYSCLNNEEEDDDKTIVTSNCKADRTRTTDELSTDSTISSYEIEEQQNRNEERTNSQDMRLNWQRQENPHIETVYNASNIKISEDMAIADAGATSHFLIKRAPVLNKQITMKPLRINLPDGAQLYSTHTATLDIPWIPPNARKAHIVPGLSHTSLISVKSLCDEAI